MHRDWWTVTLDSLLDSSNPFLKRNRECARAFFLSTSEPTSEPTSLVAPWLRGTSWQPATSLAFRVDQAGWFAVQRLSNHLGIVAPAAAAAGVARRRRHRRRDRSVHCSTIVRCVSCVHDSCAKGAQAIINIICRHQSLYVNRRIKQSRALGRWGATARRGRTHLPLATGPTYSRPLRSRVYDLTRQNSPQRVHTHTSGKHWHNRYHPPMATRYILLLHTAVRSVLQLHAPGNSASSHCGLHTPRATRSSHAAGAGEEVTVSRLATAAGV